MQARAVVVAVGLLVGCDSSSSGGVKTGPETSSQKGAGGQGGADGGANEAGAAGSSGGVGSTGGTPGGDPGFTGFPDGEAPDCSVLEAQYAETIVGAQSCDVN